MKCKSCGTSLKAGAKFCGSCGAKADSTPEAQGLAFAPSPLGLDRCDISIVEVKGEGPDSDGEIRIEIKYEVTNKSDEDWEYLVARTQLLDANGLPIEERRETYEQSIAAGDTGELETYLNSIKFKRLGANPERTRVLVNLVACGTRMQKLGEFDVPAKPFEMVPLHPVKLGDTLQMVSGNLWKTSPDSDNDVVVTVKTLIQNLTSMHLHEVSVIADINDKAGRDITNANGSEEVRPGDVCVVSGQGYGKDKQFKAAKISLALRAYFPLATGLCEHAGLEVNAPEVDETEERQDGLESENIEDLIKGFSCNFSLEDGNSAVCIFMNVVEEETEAIIYKIDNQLNRKLPAAIKNLVVNGKLSCVRVNGSKTSIMAIWLLPIDEEKLQQALSVEFSSWRVALEDAYEGATIEVGSIESSGDSRGISSSIQCYDGKKSALEVPDCLADQDYDYDAAGSTVIGYESTQANPWQARIITCDGNLYRASVWDSEAGEDLKSWIKREIHGA